MADLQTKLNELSATRRIIAAIGLAIAARVLLDDKNEVAFDPDAKNGLIYRSPHDVCEMEGATNPVAASVTATLTTALTGANNDLVFTAVPVGAAGNAISVQYLNPGLPSIGLSVAVAAGAIVVTLATNGSSVITTTAAQIAALAGLGSLVTIANAGGNDGTGVVTAMAATNLSGGVNGSGTGVAGKGSRWTNYVLGTLWINTGTKASPVWTQVATV